MDKKDPNFKAKSLKVMQEAAKDEDVLFIKASDFITLKKIEDKNPNTRYSIYEIYWNETKSGINPHEYEVMGIWSTGRSEYSSYRIWEEKEERISPSRENQLNQILK